MSQVNKGLRRLKRKGRPRPLSHQTDARAYGRRHTSTRRALTQKRESPNTPGARENPHMQTSHSPNRGGRHRRASSTALLFSSTPKAKPPGKNQSGKHPSDRKPDPKTHATAEPDRAHGRQHAGERETTPPLRNGHLWGPNLERSKSTTRMASEAHAHASRERHAARQTGQPLFPRSGKEGQAPREPHEPQREVRGDKDRAQTG